MSTAFHLNIPISKIDEEQRIVTGIATTEALDSQGDIVDYKASKKAFSEWMSIGNIREMHNPVAVGKGIDVQFDDAKKQIIVSSKISESADGQNTWTKIQEGILTGYSIGGRVFEVVKDKAVEGANRIVDYTLSELSLVDNPACPEARILMVKSVDGKPKTTDIVEKKTTPIMQEAWWVNKYLSPELQKAGVAPVDGDARDEKASTVTQAVNGTVPVKAGSVVPKKVYGSDGKSITNKSQGASMKKSVWDAQEALSLASQLTWLIMTEEPDQRDDLIAAFNALRDFVGKEVAEGDDFNFDQEYKDVMELATKALDLRKGKSMDVTKTNVVGGEERNLDAKVTETAEQAGRPVNDTTERAAEAGVPAVGEVVTDKKGEPVTDEDGKVVVQDRVFADDDKTKSPDDTARNDITPPQDKKVVDPKDVTEATNVQTLDAKEQTVNDTKEDRSPAVAVPANPDIASADEKKSDSADDLVKNVQALLTKLADSDSGNVELKKVADTLQKSFDKVAKSVTELEGRIETIEKQPLPTKGKQYQVVGKGDSEEVDTEVQELVKRRDYLAEHPNEAKPGEAMELSLKLRKANLGETIKIN